MKKFVMLAVAFVLCVVTAIICFVNSKNEDGNYLRIHIRANSNLEVDQEVKYKVKAEVVDYLTDKIAAGSTFKEVYAILYQNLSGIEEVANRVLEENGFTYKSHAFLNEEYFPTRSYNEYTLENGYYDALILNLGEGVGNNWWCVVYPPLCFIGAEGNGTTGIKYRSKFLEIIKSFFQ